MKNVACFVSANYANGSCCEHVFETPAWRRAPWMGTCAKRLLWMKTRLGEKILLKWLIYGCIFFYLKTCYYGNSVLEVHRWLFWFKLAYDLQLLYYCNLSRSLCVFYGKVLDSHFHSLNNLISVGVSNMIPCGNLEKRYDRRIWRQGTDPKPDRWLT